MQLPQTPIKSFQSAEDFGRVRLSKNFFMREFLFSEIAATEGVNNFPINPQKAIISGQMLCEYLLEPLQHVFGRVSLRSCYRSPDVNGFGSEKGGRNCTNNEDNFARHIWDVDDCDGNFGATACIMLPSFFDEFKGADDWKMLAWWIHDHLGYSRLAFFGDKVTKYNSSQSPIWAFNINWRTNPIKMIESYRGASPEFSKLNLSKSGFDNKDKWKAIVGTFPLAGDYSFVDNHKNYKLG